MVVFDITRWMAASLPGKVASASESSRWPCWFSEAIPTRFSASALCLHIVDHAALLIGAYHVAGSEAALLRDTQGK